MTPDERRLLLMASALAICNAAAGLQEEDPLMPEVKALKQWATEGSNWGGEMLTLHRRLREAGP